VRGGILFVVSLIDYSYEDGDGMNRLQKALTIWQHLLHNTSIMGVPVILLLNKNDLLANRLKKHPMSRCSLFPAKTKTHAGSKASSSCNKPAEEVAEHCIKQTAKLFKDIYKASPHADDFQGKLHWYSTCATDSKMVTGIMSSMIHSMNNSVLDMFGSSSPPPASHGGLDRHETSFKINPNHTGKDKEYYQGSKKELLARRRGSDSNMS
jgi:hypothetical protein